MSYIVLARRYRPKNFDQIVGQEHISRTLQNAITENRVAHAYLFSGPRGVGKTTAARILAKALNCKEGPAADPCDHCINCNEITSGSSVDVQEIDGASNRGIDEIRSLRENVKFSPASSKYKVYIIDEAHQITDAAFNALLKTLEEPPEHVVFILATTEPQKIPVTILSRCQRYRFRLLSSKEITAALEKIVLAEGFQIEPEALQMITASASGSMRDALSLLDQAMSFVSGTVTFKNVQDLLGFLPHVIINSTADALSRRDGAAVLAVIKEVTEQGYSLLQFARDLRDYFRSLLLAKVNPAILDLSVEAKSDLESRKELFTTGWLIRSGQLLSRALDEMRWSDQPRLIMELYLMRLAQPYEAIPGLVERLEKLEKNIEPDDVAVPVPSAAPKPAPAAFTSSAPETTTPARAQESFAAKAQKNEPSIVETPLKLDSSAQKNEQELWREVVRECGKSRPRIANIIASARIISVTPDVIRLSVDGKYMEDGIKSNKQSIEEMVEKKFGRRLAIQTVIEEPAPGEEPAAPLDVVVPEEEAAAPKEVFTVQTDLSALQDELPHGFDKILDLFPGKVTKKTNKPAE